jgi:dTDP-4-dehydrorhamnose 3,5-epimerase
VIEGLLFLESTLGVDPRGVVREFFRASTAEARGVPVPAAGWAQINVTESNLGALRGLHAEGTDKLIGIASGEGFGAWVDARPSSTTFGEVVTSRLEAGTQIYVPAGVLNGWQSLSSPAQYLYCFSREWTPEMAGIYVTPFDSTLAINWPLEVSAVNRAHVSAKDVNAPTWTSVRESLLR